ncbi:MAG: HIT family protein [Chitinophagaceae bacterium]
MTLFSKIIAGEIPCYKIAEDEQFIAFLDIFPVKKGHCLVVPKLAIDKLFDLPDEVLSGLLPFAKKVAKAVEKAYPCNRVSIITVGLDVPHAHVHLIPMNVTNDMNLLNPKLSFTKEEFMAIQQTIQQYL